MSNSQNKRNVKANGSSGASGGGKSNSTGPKVGNRKPPAKNKAIADARKAASGGNRQTAVWIIAAVVVVALAAAGIYAVTKSNSDKEAAAAARDLGAGTVSVEDGTITWGEDDAPAKVDYWIDLLCPACRQFEENASATMEDAVNAGDAQLVVHPTAILNNNSNPAGYSARATEALLCAADQPQGYKFMKQLYEQQPPEGGPGLSDAELADIAKEVGLSNAWNECYESDEFADVAEANTQAFSENGYPGTPTVLVNGEQITSNNPADLKNAIDNAAA
ncbi:DsbA family protein [Cumulibacter soli]|uniref:DsbA family protein n=1 Tax=Cumulibacter soli TaxID=2546344 RepID=UPI0010672BDD|nr:thioredoxin domain-containing protein [Cumulibacter soli]